MALVTQGFVVTITAIDNGGNTVTKRYECDPATVPDFATAQTARTSIVTAFKGVSDLVVVSTLLEEKQYEDAIVYPTSLIEAENKASITLQLLGSNKKANHKIPAPKPTLFIGASGESANQIDVTDALLTTYFGNFLTAGYFTISDGEKVAADPNGNGIIVGKRISAKNNNG